jgi:hypothetical protein
MGDPQNGWFIMEIPFEMDDLKFRGTPFSGNLHILLKLPITTTFIWPYDTTVIKYIYIYIYHI